MTLVAERLGSELAILLDRLGGVARSPRALARMVDADLKLCQRILRALREGYDQPALFFVWLPGPEGLRIVVNKILEKLGKQSSTMPIHSAVDQFEQLCFQIGGSHAGLRRRLTLPGTLGGSSEAANQEQQQASRRSIQKHAAEMLGYESDLIAVLAMIRPLPDNEELTEVVTVTALVGFRSAVGAVPLISHQSMTRVNVEEVADIAKVRPLGEVFGAPSGLITEFSSPTIPISSFEDSDGQCRHVVDLPPGIAHDIVLASRSGPDDNQHLRGSYWTQSVGIRRPTKRLLMDVYLHEKLAHGARPSIGAVLWHPGTSNDPRRYAAERLPTRPRLELLEGGGGGSSSSWNRMGSLTEHIFRLVDWPSQKFTGYRCDEPAPIWGSVYMMSFDYRSTDG